MLRGLGAVGALSAFGGFIGRSTRADAAEKDPRFLIVVCGAGGASAIDAGMAIRESESKNAAEINCYPDSLVQSIAGSPFRAIDQKRDSLGPIPQSFTANQSTFVSKHHANMMMATWTRTSVNHSIAQARSVTGNDAWKGRTLQELVALQHGETFALPNVHLMSGSGYTRRGLDTSLPAWCFGEQVADPAFWPLSLDAHKGIAGAPARSVLDRARGLRDRLEAKGTFSQVFAKSRRLEHWQHLRSDSVKALEAQGLIDKLLLVPESAAFPMAKYGLSPSPDAARLWEVFPKMSYDPLEAQAALAFLLFKYQISVTVTLGPSFNVAIADGADINYGAGGKGLPEGTIRNPPIAFDFSHQEHRSVQAFMWSQVYSVMDRLIGLLKEEEWAAGESLWDRSLMYLATDFGRSKSRPTGADEFGTGHDLDNGLLVVSPLARGNTLLGGVDPDTGLTYGFDPQTGAPDKSRHMEEREIYAGLLGALAVDTTGSGLPSVPAMAKG